jgi:DNA-directed RNA polymerase subunit N (RpoN/RPB10)
VIAKTGMIRRFEACQKMDMPLHQILDELGLKGKKKECCRNIFMTTVDNEEKINHV